MNRKNFLKKSVFGFGSIVALPAIMTSCNDQTIEEGGNCDVSPSETKGPFPIKTPSELVRENIISDRTGVALLIELTINDSENNCAPMTGVYVDIWHCDADGNYSEYGGTQMQNTNYTSQHFLRGRQMTNSEGKVSFISIFPGWYPGRAPHIHLEVLSSANKSLLVSQIAFPSLVCEAVYDTPYYNGTADTLKANDNVFADSLEDNMADAVEGNITDGFILKKIITV